MTTMGPVTTAGDRKRVRQQHVLIIVMTTTRPMDMMDRIRTVVIELR